MRDLFRTSSEAHGRPAAWALGLLFVLLPLAPELLPVLMVLAALALILRYRRPPRLHGPLLERLSVLIGPALYLLYVIGMAWSVNWDYGLFDLQIKLPLALFPLLLLVLPADRRKGGQALLTWFALGNALAVVLCCAAVPVHLYRGDGGLATEIFGNAFSLFLHPSYFALYLCVALLVVLLAWPVALRRWRGPLLVLFSLGIVLCGSKAGWLSLVMLLPAVLVLRWRDGTVRGWSLALIAGSLGGVALLTAFSPNVRERVLEAWHAATSTDRHQNADTSTEERKLAWDGARDVVRANLPWGTGTGDVKDELIASYARKGYVHMVEKRLNAHSQYLQTWATLGWPGLALLIALLALPVLVAGRTRDVLLLLFILLHALNWAVESMLEVQAGVVGFSCLWWALATRETRTSPLHAQRP